MTSIDGDIRAGQCVWRHADHPTVVPNNRPTAAVNAIASAPQNATRAEPFEAGAPPARAAIAPSAARHISETIETRKDKRLAGAIAQHPLTSGTVSGLDAQRRMARGSRAAASLDHERLRKTAVGDRPADSRERCRHLVDDFVKRTPTLFNEE